MNVIEEPQSDVASTRSETCRSEWIERFRKIRAFSEALCEPLETEDYVIQSMPDASPAKWHLAHTSWFFETFVLRSASSGKRELHPQYAYLFNSYYNAAGPMHCRPRRGMISRPTVGETLEYRHEVDTQMIELIANASSALWRDLEPVIELGLHHEQQHQELLLTDIKHLFAQNPLYPVYRPSAAADPPAPPELKWFGLPEGTYWIGHEGDSFSFDNEGPRHREFLNAFQLA